jgi:hypothetical protein
MESSTTTLKYKYEYATPFGNESKDLSLELKGENSVGLTVGSSFSLGFFNIVVDYKLAKTNTVSGGMVFAF